MASVLVNAAVSGSGDAVDLPIAGTLGPATRRTPTIDEIIAIGDPALRALWITQTYADLAERLAPAFGPDRTWCSFATWHATTAGAVIRCPDLPRMVDQLLVGSEDGVDMIVGRIGARTKLRSRAGLMHAVDRTAVRALVVDGLRIVSERTAHRLTATFERIAPLFVALADVIDSGERVGDIDTTLDAIGVPGGDTEPLLRLAFHHYVRATADSVGPHDRAQFVLTGNVALAVDEQRAADADVAACFDPANLDLFSEIRRAISPRLGPIRSLMARSIHDDIDEDVADLWHHVSTRLLMAIVMPHEILHVGRDIPRLDSGDRFPVMLDELDHPVLTRLVDEWDPTGGSGSGARAHDWADLDARVGYLFNLLRSRQRDRSLDTPPLTAGDLDAMRSGVIPPLS